MAHNKTTENDNSVDAYLDNVADEGRRDDCRALVKLMETETGAPAKMWGPAIVGCGRYHYVYDSGREGDAPLVGMSSRANAITLYLESEFEEREGLLAKLGKHKTGKGCVYIKKLSEVDMSVVSELIQRSITITRKRYPD